MVSLIFVVFFIALSLNWRLVFASSITKVCSQDFSEEHSFVYFNESPTDSMYPTINKTSIAYIEKITNKSKLQKNDIIIFKVPDMFGCVWAHRIIKIGEDYNGVYYITKGDNNLFSDFFQKIRRENIYYKIIAIK